MDRYSLPLSEMRPHYEVLVVGSGYGGGVAASRLARAGRDVCLLEMGREMQPSEYPNTPAAMIRETQLSLPDRHLGRKNAMFSLHLNPDISVFQSVGLGGTSLINGGVSLRVLPKVFSDPLWPKEIRAEVAAGPGPFGDFDRYYKLAEDMLKPRTWPEEFPRLWKMEAMRRAAEQSGLPFALAPIAVTFDTPKNGKNHVGVDQKACIGCGDCAAGCNHKAKNTVLVTYVADAKAAGCSIFTEAAVQYVIRRDHKWEVCWRPTQNPGINRVVTADNVVLAAGTIGTNEILMRSRDHGLRVSSQLGNQFSGNGDLVGWSFNTDHKINAIGYGSKAARGRTPVGPFASSVLDNRESSDFLIIEGSFPGGMARGVALLLAILSPRSENLGGRYSFFARLSRLGRVLVSLLNPYSGSSHYTQTYLVVNRDNGNGKLEFRNGRVHVKWPGIKTDAIFERSRNVLRQLTATLGGSFITQMSGAEQGLLTGHPTGGAHMAASAEEGVTNHKGQVFSGTTGNAVHKGLYVMDAALLPTSIGVNPLLTITAFAERCCDWMARENGWKIDYRFRN